VCACVRVCVHVFVCVCLCVCVSVYVSLFIWWISGMYHSGMYERMKFLVERVIRMDVGVQFVSRRCNHLAITHTQLIHNSTHNFA